MNLDIRHLVGQGLVLIDAVLQAILERLHTLLVLRILGMMNLGLHLVLLSRYAFESAKCVSDFEALHG